MKLRNVPTRLATGAYILHAGWGKWHGNEEQAAGAQGMASGAFPMFNTMNATDFLKMLSVGEMAVGAALLAPVVPPRDRRGSVDRLRGSAGDHVPAHRQLAQARQHLADSARHRVSKDVWMLAIGLGLILDEIRSRTDR